MPKGVLKNHGSMQSFVTAFLREYALTQNDVLGNQTPFCFDASAKDLYWCLRTGCCMQVIPTKLFSFPVQLVEYLNQHGITAISWVPSALSIVAQVNTFATVQPQTLRRVFFVGEVFPAKHLMYWRTALPQVEFVNLYGSSEIAGVCCHYRVDRDFASTEVLPLGQPFAHCTVQLRPVEDMTADSTAQNTGELCVESDALAACYWNDPQRTARVFAQEEAADGTVYRVLHTGDVVSQDEAGVLRFMARKDFQIKHMGYRIELEEIEAEAAALPDVAQCACIYDTQRSRIILYVQLCEREAPPTAQEILLQLKQRLCSYMWPQRVILLEEIPHNRNGKIDRPALQALYAASARPVRAR
jgi:acyl-coenzyme A synthetase/AMP-(fatty) acid ligase